MPIVLYERKVIVGTARPILSGGNTGHEQLRDALATVTCDVWIVLETGFSERAIDIDGPAGRGRMIDPHGDTRRLALAYEIPVEVGRDKAAGRARRRLECRRRSRCGLPRER